MENKLEKILLDTFGNLDDLSTEKLEGLMQETMKTFSEINQKLQSGSESAKEEALETVQSLKEMLQAQEAEISKKFGIDSSQIPTIAENTDHFTDEEWAELSLIKEELTAFRNNLSSKNNP